jgi:predicted MFS family arabinose efflux permease
MAMSNTANYVSAAVTPAVGGLVADLAGWSAMLVMGAVAAVGAVLALRHLKDPSSEPLRG